MDNNIKNNSDVIDLRELFKKLFAKKRFFMKVWAITLILSCIYILPQPRTYVSTVTLAPEMGGQSIGGALAGVASSFGIDLGGRETSDAFYPELYPDVMETNRFAVNMLYVKVKNLDGSIDKTYLDYLKQDCRKNPYMVPFEWGKKQIGKLFDDGDKVVRGKDEKINPNMMSKLEFAIVEKVKKSITCDIDIKTEIITITVIDQNPYICKCLADTACTRLQQFITDYRTKKARMDADYYKELMDTAEKEYQEATKAYASYCDSNQGLMLQSFISKRDELENDMQKKLDAFNAINTQYSLANAKVQERTPAFTILEEASVPIKAQGPKRMIFVAVMLFLATIGGSFYILKDDLIA